MHAHNGPASSGENGRGGNAGAPVWALNPDHYEAVLDAWLEGTSLRGKQWAGVSDDATSGRTAASSGGGLNADIDQPTTP